MKKLSILLLVFRVLTVSAQENQNILDKISGSLPVYMDALPLEKVYL